MAVAFYFCKHHFGATAAVVDREPFLVDAYRMPARYSSTVPSPAGTPCSLRRCRRGIGIDCARAVQAQQLARIAPFHAIPGTRQGSWPSSVLIDVFRSTLRADLGATEAA
jgi:hypothetical protein